VVYVGIGKDNSGIRVKKEDALTYAMEACGVTIEEETDMTDDFRCAMVEWFFSGDWTEAYDDECEEDNYNEYNT